jgi:predicted flavoprotein YhiN
MDLAKFNRYELLKPTFAKYIRRDFIELLKNIDTFHGNGGGQLFCDVQTR